MCCGLSVSGRARPLFGGPPQVTKPEWPQPSPYVTDLAKARQLLTQAGVKTPLELTMTLPPPSYARLPIPNRSRQDCRNTRCFYRIGIF